MKPFRIVINRVKYLFKVEKPTSKDVWGEVDYDAKCVTIAPEVFDKSVEFQNEILIHEALHVIAPEWSERRVMRAGRTLARVLKLAHRE